jgi:integrator complex subunit 3
VDGRQVQRLVCHIVARDFVMFKKDSFKEVLSTSLSWETFEQYALWHLAAAHDLPIECVISLVPKLSYLKHAEALTSVLLMLRQERPTPEIVKNLFARDVEPGDTFVTSALTSWLSDYGDQLADLISSLLVKLATSAQSSTTSAKRKRGGQSGGVNGGSLSHPAELCLGHLDAFRQKVVNQPKHAEFFNQEGIQSALQTARQTCADVQKTKFSDLFALADSDSDSEELSPPPQKSTSSSSLSNKKKSSASNSSTKSPGKSKKVSAAAVASSDGSSDDSEKEVAISSKKQRGGSGSGSRGGSKNPSRKRAKNVSYKISSEESSDDDELIKRAPKKKAKKSASAANSDSD